MARILQVCNTDFYLEKFLQPLVRSLVERGHEVTCVCELASGRAAPDVGAEVIDVAFPRGASPLGFHRSTARLREIVRARRIELVNGHNRNASLCARVAAWREGAVNLYTAHGFYFHDDQPRAAREATIALEAILARTTDFTLSQSTEDAELMVRRRLIPRGLIEIIGNGIDTRRFVPAAEGARAGKALRIAAVGRVVRGKGFGDLLRAFAQAFPPGGERGGAELVLVGGNIAQDISPYAREFAADAVRLGVAARLETTGIVHDVEQRLAGADIFVLPSYREGMPRALLEAMSAGLAVIATDIRGCREIVEDGVDGLLYAAHDVGALARALERLAVDADLRARLGQKARAKVLARFDERDYVSRQVDAIERLVGVAATSSGRSAAPAAGAPGVC